MLAEFRAFWTSFALQWREVRPGLATLTIFFVPVPTMAVIGWVAGKSESPEVIAHVAIGAMLMTIWNLGVFRFGFMLQNEVAQQMIDPMLVSRAPIILAMLGKSLGHLAGLAVITPVSVATILVMAQQAPAVQHPGALAVSLPVAGFALVSAGLVLAPFQVLSGGKEGALNSLQPLGVVLSGFLYPIDVLPAGLIFVSRMLPTSWAMRAIDSAIAGDASLARLTTYCALALLLSALYVLVAVFLFQRVDRRIRMRGSVAGV